MNLERETQVVVEALREAGRTTERYFGAGKREMGVREKSADNPVTKADLEADTILRGLIREAFPDDGWLSEETADSEKRLGKERVWIVDPIDGTKEFIIGLPEYVISIGLAVEGNVIFGAVYQPTTDVLYLGNLLEHQATRNGAPLVPTSEPSTPPRLLVSRTETKKGFWNDYAKTFRLEPFGSIAHKLCRVAAGEADAVVTRQPRSEWDIAGGTAVLRAAGGTVCLLDRSQPLFNQRKPKTRTGIIGTSNAFRSALFSLLESGTSFVPAAQTD
ncbi:MAG: 3'(2'),5'-bisphosphate nucleotidase CysQ [Candidatus Hydrogenedentota bacterium]|nr:MAG: 3'(2'),5'-bisphosphate nucleotidase CysQ [Candidatus Hydrogenedentota bacterium]